MSSGIEVPSPGEDFYDAKNVPHGEVRERVYFSKTANATRHCFVYTPPDYDKTGKNIRCSICSTAWAKTCAAGQRRGG